MSIPLGELQKHYNDELEKTHWTVGSQDGESTLGFPLEETYEDVFSTIGKRDHSGVIHLPLTHALYVNEFTIVPLRACSEEGFRMLYGVPPTQLAELENERIAQALLVDNIEFYSKCRWFKEYIGRRYGALPPIERICEFIWRCRDFQYAHLLQEVGEVIEKAFDGNESGLAQWATRELFIIRVLRGEIFFSIRAGMDKFNIRRDTAFEYIDSAYKGTIAPEFWCLFGTPHYRSDDKFLTWQQHIRTPHFPNKTHNLIREALGEAIELWMPNELPTTSELVKWHSDGFPKEVGGVLKKLLQEVEQESIDFSEMARVKELCEEKIKLANLEFLRLSGSKGRNLIEAVVDVTEKISPIGLPFIHDIKKRALYQARRMTPFAKGFVGLKWRIMNNGEGVRSPVTI